MVMFLLSFVKGSKSAEGGKNPLADMEPGGPNPLEDMERGDPSPLTDLDRGGPILGGSKSASTPASCGWSSFLFHFFFVSTCRSVLLRGSFERISRTYNFLF